MTHPKYDATDARDSSCRNCGHSYGMHFVDYSNKGVFCESAAVRQSREKGGVEVPGSHPTEEKFPEQCAAFKEIIEKMYRVHLDKNADYSPMNILATGMTGLVTRLWDKTARIMSLSGFDIRDGSYSQTKEAKNESIEDTFLDLAVYAIIGLILKRGKWGR